MTGIDYLADTNCFIYLLNEHPLMLPFLDSSWAYSYITELELLSKKGITAKEDSLIRKLLHTCLKINHEQEISDLTIKLRRKYSLKLPDSIIAATSMFTHTPLLTADNAFSRIREIDCIILEVK